MKKLVCFLFLGMFATSFGLSAHYDDSYKHRHHRGHHEHHETDHDHKSHDKHSSDHEKHQDDDHFYVQGDALFMKFRNSQLDYAIRDTDGAGAPFPGNFLSTDFDYELGYRAKIGFGFDSGWDIGAVYTYMTGDERDHVMGNLIPTRSSAYSAATTAAEVRAHATIDMHVYDLEASYWFTPRDSIKLRTSAGLRMADIDQMFNIDYDPPTTHNIRHKVEATAYGIRTGCDLHWKWHENISVFGRINGSILVGEFDSRWQELNISDDINFNNNYWHIIPVLETAFGLNWQTQHWMAQIGVELQSWFNMSERIGQHDLANPGNLSRTLDSLSLDGGFVRMAFSW